MADSGRPDRTWPKSLIKAAILLIWLGLLAWQRWESRGWPAPDAIEAAFIPDHYDLFAVHYQGRKTGWAFKSFKRLPDGSYQAAQGLRIQAEVQGRTLEIQADVSAELDRALNLASFSYALSVPPVAAREQGRVEEGLLTVNINLGEYGELADELAAEARPLLGPYADLLDFRREARLPAPAGPGLAAFLGPYFSHLGLKTGAVYEAAALDPLARRLTPFKAWVEAEVRQYDPEIAAEAAAFLVRTGPPEAGARLWLDRFGRTLKEEALGFTLLVIDNQTDARLDITPLKPPAALAAALEGGALKGLAEKLGARKCSK